MVFAYPAKSRCNKIKHLAVIFVEELAKNYPHHLCGFVWLPAHTYTHAYTYTHARAIVAGKIVYYQETIILDRSVKILTL